MRRFLLYSGLFLWIGSMTGCCSSGGSGFFSRMKNKCCGETQATPVSYSPGSSGVITSGPIMSGPIIGTPEGVMPGSIPGTNPAPQTIPSPGIYEGPAQPRPYKPNDKETNRMPIKNLTEAKQTKE